jgi:hypothetical protein
MSWSWPMGEIMNRVIQSAILIVAITSAPAWAQGKSEMKLMQV